MPRRLETGAGLARGFFAYREPLTGRRREFRDRDRRSVVKPLQTLVRPGSGIRSQLKAIARAGRIDNGTSVHKGIAACTDLSTMVFLRNGLKKK